MSPDETTVDDSELLLRRVPSHTANYHFPDGPVQLNAFLPSSRDDEGLSLYRELVEGTSTRFLTAKSLLEAATNPRVREFGGVAVVLAAEMRAISLTIESKFGELPGHVVIPQLNWTAYNATKSQKQQIKEWADKIVRSLHCKMLIDPKPIP